LGALAAAAKKQSFQQAPFAGESRGKLSEHFEFRFDPERYPARFSYEGRYRFHKHFYPRPGELDSDDRTEETACAIELDGLDAVKYWVRNLERQPISSFWLPTSTDRFYPDFVAQLTDERLFVLEYKGGHLYSSDDSREKRDIGRVWAAASGGCCVFAMVTDAATAGLSVNAQMRAAFA
jgi:type III restriction enzyme